MIVSYRIDQVSFDQQFLYLQVNGNSFKVKLDQASPKLKAANEMQRNFFTVSPSGYGIHWPLIDEDLSIEFLMKAAE